MVESQSHHWNPCDPYQCSWGDTGKWYDSWLDDLPMASHLIRCRTQLTEPHTKFLINDFSKAVSPLGVPGWLSLSNYKPSTQSTSSSSRNADKTVKFKRVKQSSNISQNKMFAEFVVVSVFCDGSLQHDRCSVVSIRDAVFMWGFFAELTWIPFSRFCRRELCHPREPVWMLLENISHVFQGGLSNTVRCSFICITITFRHPKTFIFRGFDYVSFRLKVKTVSSRDLPVTEWTWWSHWNLVGCLAQTSESRRDEKKKPEQWRLSFFPKPFLKME